MGSGPVALVADDHDMSRVALTGVLTTRLGFGTVLEAGSFDEAVGLLDGERRVEVALFDLAMPGVSGPSAFAAIREVFPEVRLVIVSGSTRRDDILGALAAGAHGYVPKTLRLDEIARVLGTVMAGEIYVPPMLATLPRDPAPPRPPDGSAVPASEPPGRLTARQAELLDLLGQGKSNKEIARATGLAAGTVKVHVSTILRALGVPNRAAAAAFAARR